MYVVIGCGKTGMDTIIYLQTQLHVDPTDILWIKSRDIWAIAINQYQVHIINASSIIKSTW
jgi:hypothetical protein